MTSFLGVGGFVTQQYTVSAGYNLTSSDLELHLNTTEAWCEERCSSIPACVAYMVGNATWGCANCCWLKSDILPMRNESNLTVYMRIGQSYVPSVSFDVEGADLEYFTDTTQAWCQAKCDTAKECKAFVFGTPGSGECRNCCWLKAEVATLVSSPGLISCVLSSAHQPELLGKCRRPLYLGSHQITCCWSARALWRTSRDPAIGHKNIGSLHLCFQD
jgi:hypothetical protein